MSSPLLPSPATVDAALVEPAGNDARFGTEASPTAAPVNRGWDPYEVWRTRVLGPVPAGRRGPND